MIKNIAYIAPHKTALTAALVMAISSLIFIIPMMIMMSFAPTVDQDGNTIPKIFPAAMVLIMPIFYFIFGYIFTGFSAWVYNKVAKFTGGIRIGTSE
ncbi:MAG: hypothetical protein KAU29_08055 [Gammaproteobacteria bacterium]|nr:hypothetical protein [Gammaproteobacteria bacterium]